jgi:hypothetical protein
MSQDGLGTGGPARAGTTFTTGSSGSTATGNPPMDQLLLENQEFRENIYNSSPGLYQELRENIHNSSPKLYQELRENIYNASPELSQELAMVRNPRHPPYRLLGFTG